MLSTKTEEKKKRRQMKEKTNFVVAKNITLTAFQIENVCKSNSSARVIFGRREQLFCVIQDKAKR